MESPNSLFETFKKAAAADEQGDVPRQNALWERIEERLDQKVSMKGKPQYLSISFKYVAAVAIGIFGIGLVLNFFFQTNNTQFVANEQHLEASIGASKVPIILKKMVDDTATVAAANEVLITKPMSQIINQKARAALMTLVPEKIELDWQSLENSEVNLSKHANDEMLAGLVPVDPNKAVLDIKDNSQKPQIVLSKEEARKISGKVVDWAGMPIAGASVESTDKRFVVQSDAKGQFELTIPKGDTRLFVEARGTERAEIWLSQSSEYNIDLAPDRKLVALYKDIQTNRTPANSDLAKFLGNTPQFVANPSTRSKRSAGARTNSSLLAAADLDGELNGSTVDLRTTKLNTPPLIIVNGLVYDGEFANINPKHIIDTKILSSTEAQLLYGPSAKNGAIAITLKKGKKLPK